jgi:hypothetical protein
VVDVADERMPVVVDPRQRFEVTFRETRLRAAEALRPRAFAQACEQRLDRGGVAVTERPNGQPVDVASVHEL